MSLSQDQRALIQLLCERGQSYGDIAQLLGLSEDEVRERTRAALTVLGGRDPDQDVELSDYLVGQADPIGRADAVRQLQSDAETLELAQLIVTKISAIAPDASLPRLPESRSGRRRAASGRTPAPKPSGPKARKEPRASLFSRLPQRLRREVPAPADPYDADSTSDTSSSNAGGMLRMGHARLIAAGVGSVIILFFVILGITGAFSSDEPPADPTAVASADDPLRDIVAEEIGKTPDEVTQGDIDEFNASRQITPVDLKPYGGSTVAGRADFGLVDTTLVANIELEGLKPKLPDSSRYVAWFLATDTEAPAGLPFTTLTPDKNGRVSERVPVPAPVAAAAGGTAQFIAITQAGTDELDARIKAASDNGATIIPMVGKRLAQGEIPVVEETPPEG